MVKKTALGKGMASLLQSNNTETSLESFTQDESTRSGSKTPPPSTPSPYASSATAAAMAEKRPDIQLESGTYLVDISLIKENPYQPRKIFTDIEIKELSDSIKENGLIQPLIVTQTDKNFELIAGERRLRASKLAGLTKVPVVVKKATDRDKLVWAIIENVQRANLNCVEEGLAYYHLMEDFKLTQDEVAKKIGKERSTIANFLRILRLPREVLESLKKEELTFGHAKVLVSLKDSDKIHFFAKKVLEEGLSVRDLEKSIEEMSLASNEEDRKKEKKNDSYDERLSKEKARNLRKSLEEKTGFHWDISLKKNGTGEFTIKFGSEKDFNTIYEKLMRL